jgi:isoleucyl-tRNA synthetase
MDPAFEAGQLEAYWALLQKGQVYRDLKPVHWSWATQTALAEAELEYKDKTSTQVYVKYPLSKESAAKLGATKPAFAVIWTTTPWTLPANEAVSVHPELTYDLVETPKGALILVRELADACLKRYGLEGTVVGSCSGDKLDQVALRHPFYNRDVAIICGTHVTVDAGTGLVHTAPAHGVDDYNIGRKYGLPVNNPVGNDGKFLGNTPALSVGDLAGKSVWEANPLVLQELEALGLLLKVEKIQHSYPHCWRHKIPIIFRATTQWFIGMENKSSEEAPTLRWIAERAVDETQFFPTWGRARLEAMMKTRPDWCVHGLQWRMI